MIWLPFDQAMASHLKRHVTSGFVIGSKFHVSAPCHPHNEKSDFLFKEMYLDAQQNFNESFGMFMCTRTLEEDIGVNCVVPKEKAEISGFEIFEILRYQGTSYEVSCQIALLPVTKKPPLTRIINLVAGPYENSQGGAYSVFPGLFTPPFPKKSETNQFLIDFWSDHVFLADAEEAYVAIKANLSIKHPTLPSLQLDLAMEKDFPGLKEKAKEVFVRRHLENGVPYNMKSEKGPDLAKLNLNVRRNHIFLA